MDEGVVKSVKKFVKRGFKTQKQAAAAHADRIRDKQVGTGADKKTYDYFDKGARRLEKFAEENGTQISPGVESDEHPKKLELPASYSGEYSVRTLYDEGRTIKWSDEARKKHEADNERRAKKQAGMTDQEKRDKAFEYHYSHPIKKKK